MGCGANILKKILIMTFDDQYLKAMTHIITKREYALNPSINFINFKQKNYLYTFLSNRQRWTWLHHFPGTYGTIIIYEGEDTENNINEIENILNSKILHKRPLVLIFDKSKINNKNSQFYETIRNNLLSKNIKMIVLFIDFSNNNYNNEILYGLDWLYHEINSY